MNVAPNPFDALLANTRVKRFPRGQIMLYEGDNVSEVFVLKSGAVKLFDIDDQGNEKILHIVQPPALVPFAFYSGMQKPLSWFYAAVNDCEVYVLPATELSEALRADPRLSEVIFKNLSVDLHEMLARLSSLGKTNVQEKLIAALHFLQSHHAHKVRDGWYRVNFSVSHQLLADLAGVTRESVALAMRDLQTQKIIRNPKLNTLEIHYERLLDI